MSLFFGNVEPCFVDFPTTSISESPGPGVHVVLVASQSPAIDFFPLYPVFVSALPCSCILLERGL